MRAGEGVASAPRGGTAPLLVSWGIRRWQRVLGSMRGAVRWGNPRFGK